MRTETQRQLQISENETGLRRKNTKLTWDCKLQREILGLDEIQETWEEWETWKELRRRTPLESRAPTFPAKKQKYSRNSWKNSKNAQPTLMTEKYDERFHGKFWQKRKENHFIQLEVEKKRTLRNSMILENGYLWCQVLGLPRSVLKRSLRWK